MATTYARRPSIPLRGAPGLSGSDDPAVVAVDAGIAPKVDSSTQTDRGILKFLASRGKFIYADPYFVEPGDFPDLAQDSTGGTYSDEACQACRDLVNSTRIPDPTYGITGFKKTVLKFVLPPGEWKVQDDGVLMADTGDATNIGTTGWIIEGVGDMTRVNFQPAAPSTLFKNINRYLRPQAKNITFNASSNTDAYFWYNASNGVAQDGFLQHCQLTGEWADGLQLDALHTVMGAVTISEANPAVATFNNHGLVVGNTVEFDTTSALPGTMVPGQVYWVTNVIDVNNFEFANNSGGTPIDTTSSPGAGIHTLSLVAANGNDSWEWEKPLVHASFGEGGALFHSGVTPNVPNQDQAIVLTMSDPNIVITSGDCVRLDYGGHFFMDGGSVVMGSTTDSGRILYMPYSIAGHELGTCHATLLGVRCELRSDTQILVESHWGSGDIYLIGCSTDGHSFDPGGVPMNPAQVMVLLDGHGYAGPNLIVKGGTYRGVFQGNYRGGSTQGGQALASFDSVEFTTQRRQDAVWVHHDADGTFQIGGCYRVEHNNCKYGTSYGAWTNDGVHAQGKVRGLFTSGINSQMGAVIKDGAVSFRTIYGYVPKDGRRAVPPTSQETVNLTFPPGCNAKAAHYRMPPKPLIVGVNDFLDWYYAFTNASGTLAVNWGPGAPDNNGEMPAVAWYLGWDAYIEFPKVPLNTDADLAVTLTPYNIPDAWNVGKITLIVDEGGN